MNRRTKQALLIAATLWAAPAIAQRTEMPAAHMDHGAHDMPGMAGPGMTMPDGTTAGEAATGDAAARNGKSGMIRPDMPTDGQAASESEPPPPASPVAAPAEKPAAPMPQGMHPMQGMSADAKTHDAMRMPAAPAMAPSPTMQMSIPEEAGPEASGPEVSGPDAAIPQGPPPPAAFSGPAHAADALFPGAAMARSRDATRRSMGGSGSAMLLVDRLETRSGKGTDDWLWDVRGRVGGDIDRLWIRSEGQGALGGRIEDAEVQALWGHAIGPWFDLQAGVRQDVRPGPDRTRIALGVQGLAPYMFDLEATAFLSTKGEATARIEATVDQRISQRLILQPRLEADLSAQAMPDLRTGAGLTTLQAGLRLRYEIRRELAPYMGVAWQSDIGRTADYARAAGGTASRLVWIAGLRAWF